MPSGPSLKKLSLDKNTPAPGDGLDEYYYTTKDLSGLLNLSPSTLSGYRRAGNGPAYVVFGYRTIRYPRAEVLAYMAERERLSTSDTGIGAFPPKKSQIR